MGPLDSLNHLLNFLAPAFWMALFMAMLGPLVLRGPRGLGRGAQWLLDFAVCSAVLLAGLWITGRDGKMLDLRRLGAGLRHIARSRPAPVAQISVCSAQRGGC